MSDDYDDCQDGDYDDDDYCPVCNGSGKVTTLDYESYLGANYKPCPECHGDPCFGEAPLS